VGVNESRLANNGQSFLEAGDDFCKLEYKNEDLSDLQIRLDRSKILTSGRKGELDVMKKYGRSPG
jgi:dipeptidyl-peptidase-3